MVKDCMGTHNIEWVRFIENDILPIFLKISTYNFTASNNNQGTSFFEGFK